MKILLIAYYFPPDSSSGAFRPLFFANHLVAAGDEVTVLSCRQDDFLREQPVDTKLLASLDARVKVVRTRVRRPREYLLGLRARWASRPSNAQRSGGAGVSGAVRGGLRQRAKDLLTDLITTPDPHVGWIPSCVRRGIEFVRNERPDVVVATGGPWSGLVCGMLLKRISGVPLVLDFRDPWVVNTDQAARHRIARKLSTALERRAVASADLLVANTEELRSDFLRRYPRLAPERAVVVTNGFEDYLPTSSRHAGGHFTLTHTGALYSSRNPRALLEAARNAVENGQIDPGKLKLRFLGGIATDDPAVTATMASAALARSIEVIPRTGYRESLEKMADSDVLLLYQPGFPLQVPRKLYEYMAARRPMLCVAERGSATWTLVERWSLGMACENDPHQLEHALVALYRKWRDGQLQPPADNRCDAFQNRNLVRRLREHMIEIVAPATDAGAIRDATGAQK